MNLSSKREIRDSEWEKFQNEMKNQYINVDETFKEKEQELVAFYSDLEKKLHIKEP